MIPRLLREAREVPRGSRVRISRSRLSAAISSSPTRRHRVVSLPHRCRARPFRLPIVPLALAQYQERDKPAHRQRARVHAPLPFSPELRLPPFSNQSDIDVDRQNELNVVARCRGKESADSLGLRMQDESQGEGLGEPSFRQNIGLPRQVAVILVVDIVDSVELMKRHEAATVLRWTECLKEARVRILPEHHGELAKSLGDGFMARFSRVSDAINAAAALHAKLSYANQSLPPDAHITLRAGINITEAWSDGIDFDGSGVNVAARVATLAGPGETILSAEARDDVVPGVDVDCEDLGICYLKSFEEGIRAFRAGAPGAKPILFTREGAMDTTMQPTIAVLPFAARSTEASMLALGDLIAEAVIDRLARRSSMRVISRLSTAPFRP